jgi:flagellar biosynthesis GTPase FlhF
MKGDLKRTLWARAARAVGRAPVPAQEPAPAPAPPAEVPQAAVRVRPPVARPAPTAERRGPMQIHRVRGRDLVDALERAARQHGPDALVLSREPAPGGGVTVAVGLQARPLARSAPAAAPPDAGLADVERLLRRSGASEALVRRTLEAVETSGQRGAFAIDEAARSLGALVAVAPSPRVRSGDEPHAHVIAFVGPTGVGKTTTLVKLASRLVRARRRVVLVSTDARSIGGRAQLEAYGELLQAPVVSAEDGRGLAASVARARNVDVVLVDTSGRSPRDVDALGRLAEELGQARAAGRAGLGLDVYLTVTATASRGALDETLLGFDAARPSALVVTKLDETREPAPVLEFAHDSGLPAAFLCDGAEIAAHLARTSPDRIADLLLRGRMA